MKNGGPGYADTLRVGGDVCSFCRWQIVSESSRLPKRRLHTLLCKAKRESPPTVLSSRERITVDLSRMWQKPAHNMLQGISVVVAHDELRIAKSERGARQVRLNLDAIPDPKPKLPNRKYFTAEFHPGTSGLRALVFEQRGESEDGHFVPLFKAVLEELATGHYGRRIGVQEFLEVVEAELNRIEAGSGTQLLTKEEQRGLIGELWFLDHIGIPILKSRAAIDSWHGPKASPKDFWFENGCLEIKTSLADARKVEISSIQQLDTEGLSNLFLLHLRLDQHAGKGCDGKTPPQYVKRVRERLSHDSKALDLFKKRLRNSQEVGGGKQFRRYRDEDERRYKDRYYVRANDCAYFRVGPKFPKFSRTELENRGIEVSSYSIVLAYCGSTVSERNALRAIGCVKGRS